MTVEKIVFILTHAKVVWVRLPPGEVSHRYLVEGHCFNRHFRQLVNLEPTEKNTCFLVEYHFGKFLD